MSATAQPQPNPAAEAALPAISKGAGQRLSAADRLERILGREFATVLVRGLARRLR